MGFKMPPVVVIVALACAGVALIFQIVGVATMGWIITPRSIAGLWGACIISTYETQCHDYASAAPDWMRACQAFAILGVLVLVACLAVGVLMCFNDKPMFLLIAAVLGFVAGLCILIEFATFSSNAVIIQGFGYSFALTVIAFLLALAAGAGFLVTKLRPSWMPGISRANTAA